MKKFKQVVIAMSLLCCVVGTASAQRGGMMGGNPMPGGFFNPVVGSGAQYEIQGKSGDKTTMEFAIVGKESVNGKDGYWMEMTTSSSPMGQMVVKVLTVVDGSNTVTSKMIMQMGGRPPMEMPAQMSQMSGQTQPKDIRNLADDVGSESVTTPAGTFTCEHYRMKDGSGDTWVSTKVFPMGVVKHQGKDTTMVLIKVSSDEKDKIVGTPQPFNPQMMMQRPPQ